MPEMIVLVDEKDNPVGYEEKLSAHRDGGKLHRAFSIFIFNSKNDALLQLRAKAKYHFQSLWSNTCCSHPTKGETLESAVHKKLKQELGFDTPLKETFSFVYKAKDPKSGLTEYEFDHVFVGQYDGNPKPNPDEVDAWKWMPIPELRKDLQKNPAKYTPWFPIAFAKLRTEDLGISA
jgi:isopentenyl-diphosphate Delta-isomerase